MIINSTADELNKAQILHFIAICRVSEKVN
jgi:hypothetical protein